MWSHSVFFQCGKLKKNCDKSSHPSRGLVETDINQNHNKRALDWHVGSFPKTTFEQRTIVPDKIDPIRAYKTTSYSSNHA